MGNFKFFFTLFTVFIYIDLITGIQEEEQSSKFKCYSCNGSNPKCSQNPTEVSSEKCDKRGSRQCYTWTANGLNYRGCYEENKYPCQNASYCEICDGSYCNDQILPTNRLKCYHCAGEECIKLNENLILPCAEHKDDNNCFTFRDDKTKLIIERGCVSLSASYNPCLTNKDHCMVCNTESCNDHSDWENIPTSTVSTEKTSEATSEQTTRDKTTSEKTTIAPEVPTSKPISFSCYKCRSDFLPACANSNLDSIQGYCRENITEETKGCYTDVHDDGVVYRGCLGDIVDNQILERCKSAEYLKCQICDEQNCNHVKPFESGSISHKLSFTILFLIVILFKITIIKL